MKKILISLVAILALAVLTVVGLYTYGSQPRNYMYHSIPLRTLIQLDFIRGEGVLDDVADGLIDCSSAEKHCVKSLWLVFSVPRHVIGNQTWTDTTGTYTASQRKTLVMLGQSVDGYLIKKHEDNADLWYFYSPIRGLLAFGGSEPGHSGEYYSVNRCGFGASPFCLER